MYKRSPKLLNQFQYCEREDVPYIVMVGDGEIAQGGVTLRDVASRDEVSPKLWKHLRYTLSILLCLFLFSSNL